MLFICFLGLNHLWLQNYDFFSKMSLLILLIIDTLLLFAVFYAKKVRKVRILENNAISFLNVYSLVDLCKRMMSVCVSILLYNNVHVHFIIIRLANIVVLSLFGGKILIFFSFCRDSTFIQQKSTRVIRKIVLTLQP